MKKADADGNGTIDYSEFVMACINLKNLLNKDQLQFAFQQFDKVDRYCHTLFLIYSIGWQWNDIKIRA